MRLTRAKAMIIGYLSGMIDSAVVRRKKEAENAEAGEKSEK